MNDESLFAEPQPDRFEHESPIRMFTEWNVHGSIAIGKGIRPSPQHLPVYLDAMEKKEGWQLGQMFLDDHGVPKTMWFRKTAGMQECERIGRKEFSVAPLNPEVVKKWLVSLPQDELQTMARSCGLIQEEEEQLSHLFYTDWYGTSYRRAPDNFGDLSPIVDGLSKVQLPEHLPLADDPVNPRHYDGTNCAQIGERLTANCYQVLKYVWRLGEKDDPVIELGKALWYLHREIALGLPASRGEKLHPRGLQRMKVVELTEGRPPLVQAVALILWNMNYGMGTAAAWSEAAQGLRAELEAHKRFYESADRGRGQEP